VPALRCAHAHSGNVEVITIIVIFSQLAHAGERGSKKTVCSLLACVLQPCATSTASTCGVLYLFEVLTSLYSGSSDSRHHSRHWYLTVSNSKVGPMKAHGLIMAPQVFSIL
jgi:hypothetical protein